jgi:hypothetical protein
LKDYDPDKLKDETQSEFSQGEAKGFCWLANSTKGGCDKCFFYTGIIFSSLFGAALPLSFIIFANLVGDLAGGSSGMKDTDLIKALSDKDTAKKARMAGIKSMRFNS